MQNAKYQLFWKNEMQNAKIFMYVFSFIQNAKCFMGVGEGFLGFFLPLEDKIQNGKWILFCQKFFLHSI
jgi:hypothetical protein